MIYKFATDRCGENTNTYFVIARSEATQSHNQTECVFDFILSQRRRERRGFFVFGIDSAGSSVISIPAGNDTFVSHGCPVAQASSL